MPRVEQLRTTGTFSTRHEAAASLAHTGDAAIVHRGVPRMLLILCPCGCGDQLVVNLDRRVAAAWRLYERTGRLTLFPSYWRDNGCQSHFVLWNSHVYWCNWYDDGFWQASSPLEDAVFHALSEEFEHYESIADQMQEIPWEVLQACHSLVRKGRAETNFPLQKGEFRRCYKASVV
jgi:hypothetical protein